MNSHQDQSKQSAESSQLEMGQETLSPSQFQNNRPEAVVQRQMQEAANSSPRVEQALQLQRDVNSSTGTDTQSQSSEQGDSEELEEAGVRAAGLESEAFDQPDDGRGTNADPGMGADAENLSWFRTTYVDGLRKMEEAQQDASTFNLILEAIHREYAGWFGNSHQGTPAESAQKQTDFAALETALVGGDGPGKFWCVVQGLETGRGDMMVKLAGVNAAFGGIKSHFQSSLDAMGEESSTANMQYAENLWNDAVRLGKEVMDGRGETLLLRAQAETLLQEGRTKFGGPTAQAPIVIDKTDIKGAREEQGQTDQPVSLHQNDGPGYAMQALKSAMVEYVVATREKESLRSELKVKKLAKVSKKTKKADPTIEPRIVEARKRKTVAETRFKSLRKTVDGLLKNGLTPELEAEIMEIDQTYMGVSKDEAARHIDQANVDRSDKSETAQTLGKVTDQLVISEANYARLRRSIESLTTAEVGANTFGIDVGVSFSIGLGSASEIKVGGGIKYSGKTDLQDDRRLRVTHSLGVYGAGSADLAGVVGASAGAELMKGKTEVFMDADHWASVMAFRFKSISKEINNLDQTQQVITDNLDVDQASEVLATSHMAEDKVTQVDSTAASGSLGASALGAGVSGGYEKKWLKFSQAGNDKSKEAKQTTKSVSFSPGSNITVSLTRTTIDGHANPDNDGKYWNVKLELGGSASANFTAYTEAAGDTVYNGWEQGLRKAMGMNPTPDSGGGDGGFGFAEESLVNDASAAKSDGNFGGIAKAISDYLGAEIATLDTKINAPIDITAGLSASGSVSVEWNYVLSDGSMGNELQYRRVSSGKGFGGSLGVPLGSLGVASVSLDLGASKGASRMESEKLGDETTTYLLTVFNGLKPRADRDARVGRPDAGEWEAYLAKHSEQVWSALCKIGAQQGGAYQEIQAAIQSAAQVSDQDAPTGMSPDQWNQAKTMRNETKTAAEQFLAIANANVGMDDIETMDANKYGTVKAALSAYFGKLGALNNFETKSQWA